MEELKKSTCSLRMWEFFLCSVWLWGNHTWAAFLCCRPKAVVLMPCKMWSCQACFGGPWLVGGCALDVLGGEEVEEQEPQGHVFSCCCWKLISIASRESEQRFQAVQLSSAAFWELCCEGLSCTCKSWSVQLLLVGKCWCLSRKAPCCLWSYGSVLLSYGKGNGPTIKCLLLVIKLCRERMQPVQISYSAG